MSEIEPLNDIALKEWSILCRAIGEGRQSLLLRKGGILDKRGEFEVEHEEFLLFPTYHHAKPGDVIDEVRGELDELRKNAPPESEVHFDVVARVVETFWVPERESFDKLAGHHLYSKAAIDYRFNYRRPGIWVLALRAYRLPETIVVPNTNTYVGCVSWVDLDEAIDTSGATPVLGDEEFARELAFIREALGAAESGRTGTA